MRLIYIANIRMPTEKAHGLQIMKMCEAFAKKSVEVELVLPWRFNVIKKDPFEYYGINKIFKITKLPSLDLIPVLGRIGFIIQSLSFVKFSFLYALFRKTDVIYSRDIFISFLLSLVGKKVVFEDHEPPKSKYLYGFFLKRIKKKVIVPFKLAELYRKLGIDKGSYIIAPNAVDIEEFEMVEVDKNIWEKDFGVRPDNKIVLYVGHFYQWKGVFTLLDSAKYLKNRVNIILIGGTKEDKNHIGQYIKKIGVGNIFLSGFMPHNEVVKYIKSADILVLPNTAREERSAKYTTPIKLFEYMASGVSMVASRLDSFSYYLKDNSNAVLFEPDNPKDLAEKINFLLNNKDLAEKLAQAAHSQAKDFTWDKRAEKIINFIKT